MTGVRRVALTAEGEVGQEQNRQVKRLLLDGPHITKQLSR